MPKVLQTKSFNVNSRNLALTHFMTSREPSKDRWRNSQPSHISSEKLILSESDEEKKPKFRAHPTVQVHT
jgi:hypothetical protein